VRTINLADRPSAGGIQLRRIAARLLCCLVALVALACILADAPARAVQPDEMLRDPTLEARARGLSQELRCLVCQNQSIDDSNAPLARDLRVLLRERLTAGDTDAEVLAFLTARYGDFVLLRPPFAVRTVVLWLGPFLLLAGAALLLFLRARVRLQRLRDAAPAPLSQAERERLDHLLQEHPGGAASAGGDGPLRRERL
jgi:cytochrome c-type biogenesis protein CcmH